MMGFVACQFADLVAAPVLARTKQSANFHRIESIACNADVALVMTNISFCVELSNWLSHSTISKLSELTYFASDGIALSEAAS
ncbi:MAG: hypothetical protein H7240_00415 [Glaciimonas sp.]|nr:hypothetical protein [Glaciimonas sp.]